MKGKGFVYRSMRMLCATPEFGDQLFDLLTPVDLSASLYAFNISLTKKQSQRYMQFWRQLFTDKSWLLGIQSHGFEVSIVGNDLITMMNWVRNPSLMNSGRRKLYLDLHLVSCVASRKYRLPSLETFDFVVGEKIKHFREFAKNDNFSMALRPGIYAAYSELIMGRDLPDNRTMPLAWLDLTIISTVKHEKLCKRRCVGMRMNSSTSTGLWYGDKTMRRYCNPCIAGGRAIDMGVLLEMEHISAISMPMDIIAPRSWCVTWVESKTSYTGAYIFRQQRLFDCAELLNEIEHVI
ncbi:hypothetical protein EJ07DRAFT_152606 [Lizonia empirigonia]|nr:hypothetical protein EJ07DRAFT_152606 [Lizonia empirigonia]